MLTWTTVNHSRMNVLVYADWKRWNSWLSAVSYIIQTHPLGTDAEALLMVGTIEDTTHCDREVFHTQ